MAVVRGFPPSCFHKVFRHYFERVFRVASQCNQGFIFNVVHPNLEELFIQVAYHSLTVYLLFCDSKVNVLILIYFQANKSNKKTVSDEC